MLLGTSTVASSKEDLDISPTIQFPVSLNTDVQSMFPVAELSYLNNTDLSFLDNICIPGNQHTGLNMTDLSTAEGSSLNELDLPLDWLSENTGLHNLCGEESFLQSINFDHVLSPSISDSSYNNCPTNTAESSSNTFEIQSLADNSLFTEMQMPEERLYSSSDECGGKLTDINRETTSPASETMDTIDTNVDEFSMAGKKYLQMRQKNNIASQRSRKLRKQKNQEMVERLKKLESENLNLTKLATELEKQRDALQKKLLLIISKK